MEALDRESGNAVRVEVIAFAPTAFYHCQHCELTFREAGFGERFRQEQLAHALPEDLLRDYQTVSDWVRGLTERYCGHVVVKVIDAASVEGVWKSLRYRVRRYPAVVVEGKEKCAWADRDAVHRLIERYLPAPSPRMRTEALVRGGGARGPTQPSDAVATMTSSLDVGTRRFR